MAQASETETPETRTYSLTPEQFDRFMADMPDLASFVHLDARIELGQSYSTGTIARGSTQEERERLGLSGRPEDSVASLRRYFDRETASPTRYTIRTDDPAIQAKLQDMGITGATDQERMLPVTERMRELLDEARRRRTVSDGTLERQFDWIMYRPDGQTIREFLFAGMSNAIQQPTCTLTPEQFNQLMQREDMRGLVALDDLVAHIGPSGSYSMVYIQTDNRVLGQGAIATAESHYNRFTGRPESYVLRTSDPRILNALRDMGIQPQTDAARAPETAHDARQGRQSGRR